MAISAPTGAREGECFSDRHGLTKAGFFAGLTFELSGTPLALRLSEGLGLAFVQQLKSETVIRTIG